MGVGNGFFMVKFDLLEDKKKSFHGSPWMIFYHHLTVRPWVSNFISSGVTIGRSLVWIYFLSLGMKYCEGSLLLALVTGSETPS